MNKFKRDEDIKYFIYPETTDGLKYFDRNKPELLEKELLEIDARDGTKLADFYKQQEKWEESLEQNNAGFTVF